MPRRKLSTWRTRRFRAKVFATSLLLVLAAGTVIWFYLGGLSWKPTRAALSITIWNETDHEIGNASETIEVIIPTMFNLTLLPSNTTDFTILRLYPYVVQVTINNLSSRSTLSVEVTGIYPITNLSADLNQTEVEARFFSDPRKEVNCSFLFAVYGDTPFGPVSLGSSYGQYVGGVETYRNFPTDRYNVRLMYYTLGASTILVLAALPIAVNSKRMKEHYPFTTLIITSISLALYVFLGTEFDIRALLNIPQPGGQLLLPFVNPEIHASYIHITGNLPFFLIIGGISEWVAQAGAANAKRNASRFSVFFLLPLLGYSFGYGLSGMIESMGVIFCAYAILNRRIIAESATSMGLVFVSGLTIFAFYGWLMFLVKVMVLLFTGSPYVSAATSGLNWALAISHIWYTIATSLAVVIAFCCYKVGISRKHKLIGKLQSGLQRAFEDQPAPLSDVE